MVVEEAALVDGTLLADVIIPMMNIPRLSLGGGTNPTEPHSQQIYITSAGSKTCFAYNRLIELTVQGVLKPEDYFICGSSYELPLHYGLFDKKTIMDQKLSSTFSEDSFARESMSIWTGSSNESWFNNNKLVACRRLLHAEREAHFNSNNPDIFYIISIDVARTGYNESSIMVIKVMPHDSKPWTKRVVYTENISKKNFAEQAMRVKELNAAFHPREIVVDGNTIGTGLLDNLVMPSIGAKGEHYEPLYVVNEPETYPLPRGEKGIVYSIKANATMNNDIYSNLYVQFHSGNVSLLANERVAKEKLLLTKKGQRMNLYAREKFLLPYIMTSRLIDEMNNLKLRPTGAANQLAVEQISKRINKDRVSALSYGLYRIKYYEDKAVRRKKKGKNTGQMMFYSAGKNKSR